VQGIFSRDPEKRRRRTGIVRIFEKHSVFFFGESCERKRVCELARWRVCIDAKSGGERARTHGW
jgi:hypothetical protein